MHVFFLNAYEAKGEDIQNSGNAGSAAWGRDNERRREETGSERHEEAAMDVWSHEERLHEKRTCERTSKSSTGEEEDYREKATKVVGT